LLLDSEIAAMFHHGPAVRKQWSQLPRLSSKESFAAGTPSTWWKVMIKEAEARNLSPARAPDFYLSPKGSVDVELPEIANEVELYVQLERIGSTACESSDLSTAQESRAVLECQSLRSLWLSRYCTTPAFQVQEQSLMMLWHSIFIRMYSDLDMLEIATGRDGPKAAKEAEETVKSWARSPEAARSALHCMLVQRQFAHMPIGKECPLHTAACLFRSGIVWYSYVRFGCNNRFIAKEQGHMREFQSLKLDLDRIFLEEMSSRVGKPLELIVLKTVDLLQRITHWKVADRLASTLLALLDGGHGLS